MATPKSTLPDIQATPDTRGIAIDQVGVSDLRYPIQVLDQDGKAFPTVAKISMSVHLPHHFKGTHMSRFLEVLSKHEGEVTMRTLPDILHDLKKRLDAEEAHIEVAFTYFVTKKAPVSGSCSKEISEYGAHNQRGYVTLEVRPKATAKGWELILIEDLIEVAEKSGSAPVYALLKRTDERFVTMQAYDNPVFVEDVVRNAAALLRTDKRVSSFTVKAVNHESIHDHNAFATIIGHALD
jgi:GTP cyclohydrolase I